LGARLLLCTGALLATSLPAAAAAQQLPREVLDQRVRLELQPLHESVEGKADPQVIRGTVLELPGDSVRILIHDGAAPLTVAASAIAHADLSQGIRTEIESALEGAGHGAVVGALEWGLFNGLRKHPVFHQSFAQSALFGGVVGGLIGGVLGALRPQERWQRLR
jgi:hypothetical protein